MTFKTLFKPLPGFTMNDNNQIRTKESCSYTQTYLDPNISKDFGYAILNNDHFVGINPFSRMNNGGNSGGTNVISGSDPTVQHTTYAIA